MRRVGDNAKVPPVSRVPNVRPTPDPAGDVGSRTTPAEPKGDARRKPPERRRRGGVVDEYA